MATDSMEILLKGRPDTDRENTDYVTQMVEVLSWLSPEEHGWLRHPRDGLNTVCKFLPTPADVHEFLRAKRAKAEQFVPAATAYRKLVDDPDAPWNKETDVERKKRVVRELLGYNPGPQSVQMQEPRTFSVPTPDEVRAVCSKLKTPAGEASSYLKALIAEQQEQAA